MSAPFNHSIVWCRDKQQSSALLARILGIPPPRPIYNFMMVQLANGVSLDFMNTAEPIAAQHYA